MTKYEKWLYKQWAKWAPVLLIERHDVVFKRDDNEYMTCSFNNPYLDIVITWSKASRKRWRRNKAEHLNDVVHEFCHIITNPLYGKATSRYLHREELEYEREQLTDHIRRIVYKKTNA